ncbi:MAG: small subunit ribosomal protein S18 [Parcubacteria group bacterium Athens1014_10]|nr:MAG: small subunit ribosomal protein S18 [Parcubacteria group bacterium Athens1014_10]TSD05873.1 MAG: small subunit ribosomal protein S18 [Parcubacteria group bacterium Athens0714_12]
MTKPIKKVCYFCQNNIKKIDYKDTNLLQRFFSTYCQIMPKRKTGVCSKHQKKLAQAIKNARFMALFPYLRK